MVKAEVRYMSASAPIATVNYQKVIGRFGPILLRK